MFQFPVFTEEVPPEDTRVSPEYSGGRVGGHQLGDEISGRCG